MAARGLSVTDAQVPVKKRIAIFILHSVTVAVCLAILVKLAFELKWLKCEAPVVSRVSKDLLLEGRPFNDFATLKVVFRYSSSSSIQNFGHPVVQIESDKLSYEFVPPTSDLVQPADVSVFTVGSEFVGDGRIKLRMRRNGDRLHTFIVGVEGVLECHCTPFAAADSPAAEALRLIGSATKLESAMLAPGEIGIFPTYVELKQKASRDEVAELLTSSANPVAVAYCLLYFSELDEAFCREHLQYLKSDKIAVQKYGVTSSMSREVFEETLFNQNLRWHFTSGIPGK